MTVRQDPNDLAHWFGRLRATGVPVPRTTIVRADGPLGVTAGEPMPAMATLVRELDAAAAQYGYPVFLRTGHGSGKHQWKDTCFVPDRESLQHHVLSLLEWSEIVDFMGLPTETWVVREMLPLVTLFRAFGGRMPVNKERRYFIADGRVVCRHPYWPPASIQDPDCEDWGERLMMLNRETDEEVRSLTALSERVAQAFDGAWSLDWAASIDGRWYAIDMAVASESFHWKGCPERARLGGPPEEEERRPFDADSILVKVDS
jgi:hypothetical protein